MQFLLMLVSVGRTAVGVRVTRIGEMGSERRSLGVKHPQAMSRLRGNSGDPNVRITVAVENHDGIDRHRHALPEVLC